ncbi:uncharacterized protein SPPG_06215 [Spizellomyces punctatus DAOM BR117]|uniref:Mitochondrial carrier n=1 Tax=Spizellomyces punctatus (strain DAOM BR117) TaxID=645134 RepID=A0A0L0HBD8_SPIPD|nr:uncharacterized protein SPPG_06215 [Spizellomyces punctatus DAOM BR117]KNC98522.1 hypothetical protein SPPG_06215 [Spizellomyces punctatus DAOM BR117]|eukprot:XP_016606562.1 hypothetical protein SPPG_06215 [Spizellomyces punctatus DAOM BR117]
MDNPNARKLSHTQINIISTFLSGLATFIAFYPLEVVELRLQVQKRVYKGLIDALRRIRKEEGLRALYRGFPPALIQATLGWACYYCAFDFARHVIYTEFLSSAADRSGQHHISHHLKEITDGVPVQQVVQEVAHDSLPPECRPEEIPPAANLAGAAISGALCTLVFNPLQVLKLRMVTAPPGKNPSMLDTFRSIVHHPSSRMTRLPSRVKTLWKGTLPALFGVSEGCIQFTVYERLKASLPPHPTSLVLASTTARFVSGVTTYPYQVLRSRLQNSDEYRGVLDACKRIGREEGLAAFWRGVGPNLVRTVPPAGFLLTMNDVLREALHRRFGTGRGDRIG